MPNRFFADISNNNSIFDAKEYKKGGHLLIMLKATEGVSFSDPTYRKRRHQAHENGLVVVHYHFAHPELNAPRKEAEHFSKFIFGGVGKYDGLVIDVERGTNAQASQAWINEFEKEVERHYPHHPLILYRSRANHTNIKTSTGRTHIADFSGHIDSPKTPSPEWAHQFTDGIFGAKPHQCRGIGQCDVNRINLQSYNRLKKIVA